MFIKRLPTVARDICYHLYCMVSSTAECWKEVRMCFEHRNWIQFFRTAPSQFWLVEDSPEIGSAMVMIFVFLRAAAAIACRNAFQVSGHFTARSSPETALFGFLCDVLVAPGITFSCPKVDQRWSKRTFWTTDEGSWRSYKESFRLKVFRLFFNGFSSRCKGVCLFRGLLSPSSSFIEIGIGIDGGVMHWKMSITDVGDTTRGEDIYSVDVGFMVDWKRCDLYGDDVPYILWSLWKISKKISDKKFGFAAGVSFQFLHYQPTILKNLPE